MRKLLSTTFITLDGVMQAPGGPEEDLSLGFEYGGWSAPLWDQESNAFMADTMGHEYDLLLGRKTWDIFAAYWPNHPEIEEVATQFNKCNKYVRVERLGRIHLGGRTHISCKATLLRQLRHSRRPTVPNCKCTAVVISCRH